MGRAGACGRLLVAATQGRGAATDRRLVFRGLAIGAGSALIERVQWITYPFAFLILFAAWRLVATPLLVALVVIETTDIVFAPDSIPPC